GVHRDRAPREEAGHPERQPAHAAAHPSAGVGGGEGSPSGTRADPPLTGRPDARILSSSSTRVGGAPLLPGAAPFPFKPRRLPCVASSSPSRRWLLFLRSLSPPSRRWPPPRS